MKTIHIRIIFILIIILFSCFIYVVSCQKEYFEDLKVELVVSRYNEPLDWLKDYPFKEYDVIIYNKGPNVNFTQTPNITNTITLKNVGRCDHTYLYHIVNNYDNLADITVFLPGSCNMENKKQKATRILEHIKQNKTAVFISDGRHENVKTELYDFVIDEWTSSDENNKIANPEKTLEKSPVRPYGKWFETNFDDLVINHITYMGIFSVSKEDILQHPLEYYKKLMGQLETSSNPEVGHYIERSWTAVFHPMNNTKIVT